MSVKSRLVNLADLGTVLATRELGREAADQLHNVLDEVNAAVINFTAVDVATPSFLGEILTRLQVVLAQDRGVVVVVTGMNPDVKESLELVLERRGLVLAELADKQIDLLGGTKQLEDTLEAAQRLGTFRASDLAKNLRVKLPNMHQRLKALVEAGVLARELDGTAERGRRYDFSAPDPKKLDPKKLQSATLAIKND